MKTQKAKNKSGWRRVSKGIYVNDNWGDTLYERPKINGNYTFRSLGTNDLETAENVLAVRRTKQLMANEGVGESPYAEPKFKTVGEVLQFYAESDYIDPRRLEKRADETRLLEKFCCDTLLLFWDNVPLKDVRPKLCDDYMAWRIARKNQSTKKRKGDGRTIVDRDLRTLSNAFHWAVRKEKMQSNPLVSQQRPKYKDSTTVKHCFEFMPEDGDQLHEIAAFFFRETPHPKQKRNAGEANVRGEFASPYRQHETDPLGWQTLVEAMTSLRTREALKLRWDAKPGEPGYISPDWKTLHVRRVKRAASISPWIEIHPALKTCLLALKEWRQTVCPQTQWFFPSLRLLAKGIDKPVDRSCLSHGLIRYKNQTGKHFTSHSLRSFFVKVRRSQGRFDSMIAAELGHTDVATLQESYGTVPPNWLLGEAPEISWMPSTGQPAWTSINYQITLEYKKLIEITALQKAA